MFTKRKIICLLIAALSCCVWASAPQIPLAKDLFVAMPDSLMPLLTQVNRADCIDFLESNMKAKVTNRFGNVSEMRTLTETYISLDLTAHSRWQMKVLPVSDSLQVIAVVTSVNGPACDSYLRFYSTDWKQEYAADDFCETIPSASAFIQTPDSVLDDKLKREFKKVDMLLLEMTLDSDKPQLSFKLSTLDYLDKESANQIGKYILPAITYTWVNAKFRKQNKLAL